MEKEIRLHGYTVHLESPGKTVIELTPEELVRQLFENLSFTDYGGLMLLFRKYESKFPSQDTCQCKEPNFRHDSNTYSYCATCGKPIAGKVAEKKIEPLNTDIFCKVNVIMTEAQYRVLTWDKINEIIKKMEEKQ